MTKTLSLVLSLSAVLAGCATPGDGVSPQRPALASDRSGLPPLADLGPGRAPQREGTPLAGLALDGDGPVIVTPVDPLDPDRPVDTRSAAAQADLWERVRLGFAMPDLDNDLVRSRERFYASKPDYMQRMTERGGRYLYHVVSEIEKRGMPTELALLPFVESAFNPHAMSSAKASGMWQFVPATGRDFDLKQNVFRDDRRDVLASTRAALDYLQRLYNQFNDWHLALAAYNWGEGSVQRAIKRNEKAGLPTDYASLRMPEETRYYVPKLQAIKNIIAQPDAFAIRLPALKNHPYFLSVPLDRDIDVTLAAQLAGVSLEEFRQLNPQMNKPVILAAGTEQLLLPYDAATRFVDNVRRHRGQLATWTAWVAPKTLHPSDAARQVGMSESELREVNRIPPRMLVKAGSTLLVPRSAARAADDVSGELADGATIALAPDVPPLRKVSLKTGRKGDTVAALAKRHGVSAAQFAQWNKVGTSGRLGPNASYVVYQPAKAKASGTAVASARPGKASPSSRRSADAQVAKAEPKTAPRKAGSAKPTAKTSAKPVRTAKAGGKDTGKDGSGRNSSPVKSSKSVRVAQR